MTGSSGHAGSGGRMIILDPSAESVEVEAHLAPRLASIGGKTVGMVSNGLWRTWDTFADRLEENLLSLEPSVYMKRLEIDSEKRLDKRKDSTHTELERFAAGVDAAIVGLGN